MSRRILVGGRPEAARTKLFGLSGHARPPGVVQMTSLCGQAAPRSLRTALEHFQGRLTGAR